MPIMLNNPIYTVINYCRSGNFRCKNLVVVYVNHENTENHYAQHMWFHSTAQHSTANSFAQDSLFDTHR